MTMQLPNLLRPDFAGLATLSAGEGFTVLTVGCQGELTRQVHRCSTRRA